MKKFIYKSGVVSLSLAFVVGILSLFAFNNAEEEKSRPTNYNSDPDTLVTSTSLDTVTFTPPVWYSSRDYSLQINADSISGATGATCYMQVSTDLQGDDWVTVETITIDGVTTRQLDTGTIKRGAVRIVCYAPSTTQSTAVRVDLVSVETP